ncbi:hypothetical protein [Flavobacterium sp. CAU 1735]|uniref:hypothetical protein n=1 Tax=Flavobacterium sp. CAU 1735 TaxID=3140361 RepID=UPI0032616137
MKLNKLTGIAVLALFATVIGCQSDDTNGVNPNGDADKVILNSDINALNQRISFSNSGVLELTNGEGKMATAAGSDFPLALVAEVNPPSYNGKVLKATHVDINGVYAYVSYNTEGDTYLGAIDVINISNPNNPQLVVQAIFPNSDISAISYNDGFLYIAGASGANANSGTTSPAFVAKMPLQNGLLTNNYASTSILGNVTMDIFATSSKYYAVSGYNGELVRYNKSNNTFEASIPVADLRALGSVNNKIVVLSGTQGVKVYDQNTFALQTSFATSQDVADAKRTIDFSDSRVLVSEGYNGLGVYNLTSGAKSQTIAVPTNVAGANQQDIVTNAVSVNNNKAFVANGAAGLYIYNTSGSLSLLGSLALNASTPNGSANYVKSSGDYIFVANGNGGLKIIKMIAAPVSSIDCTSFPNYPGDQWLNVNSGQDLKYKGSASVQGVNVNANLTFCGSMAVSQGLNINSGGVFYMKGTLAQGQANNPYQSLNINSNAKLKVEGSVVIYGNLVLNSGATLEFVGSGSSITIYGSVTKGNNVTITGNYTDTFNKLN